MHLIIRRLKCSNCGRIIRELLDIDVHYKRYESAIISQVLEKQEDSRQDSYCENSTIRGWELLFLLFRDYLESTIHAHTELWHCAVKIDANE